MLTVDVDLKKTKEPRFTVNHIYRDTFAVNIIEDDGCHVSLFMSYLQLQEMADTLDSFMAEARANLTLGEIIEKGA
jgi:hypothetical protein